MQYIWERGEMYTQFQVSCTKERGHLEDLGVAEREGIKMDLKGIGWVDLDYIHLAQGGSSVGSC
jgi:hypothetical protein